nr:hypothetical protein [Bacilli bacterium]
MDQKISIRDELQEQAVIVFHPFGVYEGDSAEEFTIGRLDTSEYIVLESDALELMNKLNDGYTVGQVLEAYREYELTPEDVHDFIVHLAEANFVHRINGKLISETMAEPKFKKRKENRFVSRFFFNRAAWSFYALCLLGIFLLLYADPALRPKGADLFISESGVLSFLFILVGTWVVVFIHEFGHVFAARKVGLDGKINWGYRTVLLVIETDVSDIYSVPRRDRYAVYLGGLAWTCTAVFLMMAVQWLPLSELWMRIARFFVLLQMQTFVMQFLFFMKTDLYFAVANYFKSDFLNEKFTALMRDLLVLKIKNIKQTFREWDEQERKLVKAYTAYNIAGVLIAIYLFAVIDIPVILEYLDRSLNKMLEAPLFSLAYWDGIALGTLVLNPLVILIVYVIRDLIQARKAKQNVTWVQ